VAEGSSFGPFGGDVTAFPCLLAWRSGLDPAWLGRWIASADRDALPELPWVRLAGGVWSADLDLPTACLEGARQILPSCSLLNQGPYAFRFFLGPAVDDERLATWLPLDHVGPVSAGWPPGAPAPTGLPVAAEIDVFRVTGPLPPLRVRLFVQGFDEAPPIGLVTVSVHQGADTTCTAPISGGVSLPVPAASQMQLPAAVAHRTCSPTCLAMVLAYHGRPMAVLDVVQLAHHQPTDLYGVWPANIWAASRLGRLGYLSHLPGWPAVTWLLDRGLPVIASIRFEAGELDGAPVSRTSGHLIVVRGYCGSRVLVNDPAAPDEATVAREYDQEQLLRVWLARAAVGYVLLPPWRCCEA
jgi:hypothetical protein